MSFRIEAHAQPIPGYRLIERLGSGGFGEVWKAEAPGGIFKAIKFIHGDLRTRDNDLVRYAEQELKALNRVKTVRHPYLLSLDRIDIVEGRLMIIMELADCNLWDRFRHYRQTGQTGIPREELLRYMVETAEVLDLMNDTHNLQHLDIKPQNLFLLHHHVKVADFGQVKDLQGAAAEVTGGITPVYAAPETFDGYISKYCDQYSLACVYQELLTGVRPFDGTTLQQLLLQHIEQPPNLDPSPLGDRATLVKALAKKPEQRFPSCSAFVQGLIRQAIPNPSKVAVGAAVAERSLFDPSVDPAEISARIEVGMNEALPSSYQPSAAISVEMTGTPVGPMDTPFPRRGEPEPPPARIAPPEETGPGTLCPTLIIGLGGLGQQALRRFRRVVGDRFGSPDALPLIRTLYIDTDPADLEAATTNRTWDGMPGLNAESVFAAKLYRAGHYLKPRLSGRSLIEGWFDPQLLYRIGRVPVTNGIRAFGRLAFCDNFRALMNRLDLELTTALDPTAFKLTQERTGLALRSNRPRVYIVGGLGGGTASGMFIDLAYSLRAQMKFLGYDQPDLVGAFFLPPDAPVGEIDPLIQSNVYAALTELNHYSRAESIFHFSYDDRNGTVRDSGSPFRSIYLFPGASTGMPGAIGAAPPRTPGGSPAQLAYAGSRTVHQSGTMRMRTSGISRTAISGALRMPADARMPDPTAPAIDLLKHDLFTPLGRSVEAQIPTPADDGPPIVRTLGTAGFDWPRGVVVNRTAGTLARIVLANWASPDVKRAREYIPGWTSDGWSRLGLDPDPLVARLMKAASDAVGGPVEKLCAAHMETLMPKGWLARMPEPAAVVAAVNAVTSCLGHPAGGIQAQPTALEVAVAAVGGQIAQDAGKQLAASLPQLCDDPTLRLAGAEEAAGQFLATIDRLLARFVPQIDTLDATARLSFERILAATTSVKGRKPQVQEFTEATQQFPKVRLQAVLFRQLVEIYSKLREKLTAFLSEVSASRLRLEAELAKWMSETDTSPPPRGPRTLLPPGCASTQDSVNTFVNALTDDDLSLLERRIQSAVVEQFGGLYNACLNTSNGIKLVLDLLKIEARSYLDARLGDIDFAAMLGSAYRSAEAARNALTAAAQDAVPTLAGPGPWTKSELMVVGMPPGPGAEWIQKLVVAAIPGTTPMTIETKDEIVFYRILKTVPLSALPQLGPTWENAYTGACEAPQGNPHTRCDITKWISIDAG